MERLISLLKEKNMTISSCESLTGGLFASSIVDISGASSVFVGSYVTYQDKAKSILLNGQEILDKHGAISEEMAILMASVCKDKFKSNISVSFTGNAGPLSSEGKDVGLVYIGIIINDKTIVKKYNFKGSRKEIRELCISNCINELLLELK